MRHSSKLTNKTGCADMQSPRNETSSTAGLRKKKDFMGKNYPRAGVKEGGTRERVQCRVSREEENMVRTTLQKKNEERKSRPSPTKKKNHTLFDQKDVPKEKKTEQALKSKGEIQSWRKNNGEN